MYVSIRTTIFWNICLLMIAAIALISFVVFRITEREIVKQRISGDEEIFNTIRTTVTQMIDKNIFLLNNPATQSELQVLIKKLTDNTTIEQIILINPEKTILAHSYGNRIGQTTTDADLIQALDSGGVVKKLLTGALDSPKNFSMITPLFRDGTVASGALKVVFSMKTVSRQIAQSNRMILLYILVDALILILSGTFLLSRYLVKPINKLINLTENISKGNFESTLYLEDRNEIGRLAASLSQMAEHLNEEKNRVQEHIRALEDKSRELQQVQQEIIQSEKLASVGRLAAGVAHEIGNPIGIILGYLDLMLTQTVSDQERTDYIKRIHDETERINKIIHDLLDYAQPSSLHTEELDLNSIIEGMHSLVSYQKSFRKIQATFDLIPVLPPLYADENQIRQVMINLTLNALDAMPDGGSIRYSTSLGNISGTDYIVFTLSDTGEGIPEEIQNRIFDPFFTTKAPRKGTGLGLSNAQRIVAALGGTITVSSSPGTGTTFTILFPCTKKA